jgi:hypothetical protein
MPEQQSNNDKSITVTLPDGKTAQRIVDMVVSGKKPPGYSRRSVASYYTEDYAMWMKRDLDVMLSRNVSRIFLYKDWPQLTPNSLYLRIMQGWAFLMDECDPSSIYKNLWHRTKRNRVNQVGITISFKTFEEGKSGHDYSPQEDIPKWRKLLDEYLESEESNQKPFVRENLILTPDQVELLKQELSGLSNVLFSVDSGTIKVIKS